MSKSDFAYEANHPVANVAKQFIADYYGKPAFHSHFADCYSNGREDTILTQRYPNVSDGIVTGALVRILEHRLGPMGRGCL